MGALAKVGYIGLGNIGKPSAVHLLKGDWETCVYDVYAPVVEELVEKGATACESPGALAAQCEHIGICVRDDEQVESLLYGHDGLIARARPGTLIAIHSTVTREGLQRWAADAAEKGIGLIDAAISGGAAVAEKGGLCYMVGGSAEDVERATPVFMTSGQKVVHAGDLGCGMLLKVCNNTMTYAEYLAISEAKRLAEAGGLNLDMLREVGSINGVVCEGMYLFALGQSYLKVDEPSEEILHHYDVFGRLAEKDIQCALDAAKELGVDLPSTERLRQVVYDLFMGRN